MTASIRDAAHPFTGGALTALLSPATRLLGLGEPTHGVEAFDPATVIVLRHKRGATRVRHSGGGRVFAG